MAISINSLEQRYLDSCKREGAVANKAILFALLKADGKKVCHNICSLVILLDELKDVDYRPLLDLFMGIDGSEIEAVDILQTSSCFLNGEYVLLLLRAIGKKLRVVDLQDMSFGKDFLLNLSQRGLTCQILNLRSSHFRKLNLTGEFRQIHTLNLDFSASLTSFREDCFINMPNLTFISLCETKISNLWTSSAALSKLSCLVELRFQNCLIHSSAGSDHMIDSDKTLNHYLNADEDDLSGDEDEHITDMFNDDDNYHEMQSAFDDSSDDSEVDFSRHRHDLVLSDLFYDALPAWNGILNLQSEISVDALPMQEDEECTCSPNSKCISNVSPQKYRSYNSSPICYEKHYREFMIASLPNLKTLDNLPIKILERERAKTKFSQHFEYLPYKTNSKKSITSILNNRQINSRTSHSKSLTASRVGSSPWPHLKPISFSEKGIRFRPRQFEYHPTNPSLMVFGTLDGEVVTINHETDKIVSHISSDGLMNSVLGLCWLKTHPSKLVAGSDNGLLKMYDIQNNGSSRCVTFDEFDQLTSVHVNSSDQLFLASGYSTHVALYDISTGQKLQVFTDMHKLHINVVKFANYSPSIFATSSFDKDVKMWDLRQSPVRPCYTTSSHRGNVMVCFSPDDHYLLASAVDNEVKQLLAVDGRLHMDFGISPTGSLQNYTRSYYLNGRDYIISGSCDEHVVRICCAQTGRRLRDISLEVKGSGSTMFVQSLRGDPFREFNMSILATHIRPSSNTEIVKVNLLASSDSDKDFRSNKYSNSVFGMGG